MDDLFTIFIIIAAIISFLSKLFRQSREAQTKKSPTPADKPKPSLWQPPWLDEGTFEPEISSFETMPEMIVPTGKVASTKPAAKATKEWKESAPALNKFPQPNKTELSAHEVTDYSINLASSDEVRQGIILAEILGPCKANRKSRRN